MKRWWAFADLPREWQEKAVEMIERRALARTRYCGEVWEESARTLAARCRFQVTQRAGRIVGLWDHEFPKGGPRLAPGTEFRPRLSFFVQQWAAEPVKGGALAC